MNIKNIFLSLALVLAFASCQEIPEGDRYVEVVPEPTDRVILLTEFTGWNCVNCPDAAEVAHKLGATIPNNIVVVGMHPKGHGFTTPKGDALDFTSQEAMDYLQSYGGSASTPFPAGVINGKQFDGSYLHLYSRWTALVSQEYQEPVYATLMMNCQPAADQYKVSVTVNPTTLLDTKVSLLLWLTESGIIGMQNSHHGYIKDYEHNHVFRKKLTDDLWGKSLGEVKIPTVAEFSFTIDEAYVADNCSVIAILVDTETHEVFQAAEIRLNGAE